MDNPIRRCASPLSEQELAALEDELGLALPEQYRAFLLAHNGGVPRRHRFWHINKKGQKRETWLRWIYSVGREGLIDPGVLDVAIAYQNRPRGLAAGMLPVADAWFSGNDGCVCLACTGAQAGHVFFRPNVDPEKTTLYTVADSWDSFITGMTYDGGKPVPWKEAIQDGDASRLREWLERHRKKWKNDRAYSIDIERAAVEENQWPAVVLLMEFGFEPDSLFEEALRYDRYDLAQRLLQGGGVSAAAVEPCLTGATTFLWHLPSFVEELIAAGADVNHESDSGETPLHAAVQARSVEALHVLLGHGADPTVKNDDGRTPLGLARRLEEPRLAEVLRQAEEDWKKRPAAAESAVVEFDFHGVEITQPGPPLTLQDIQAFEKEIGLVFPPAYRFLLLKANGFVPRPNVLPIEEGDAGADDEDEDEEMGEDYNIEPSVEFLPLRKGQGRMVRYEHMNGSVEGNTVENAREWYHDGDDIPRGTVPIGWLENYQHEGAWLLLGCKGKNRGQLFACYHGTTPLKMTLPNLFRALQQAAARPKTPGQRLADAIEARDLAGVGDALAAGAKPLDMTREGRLPLRLACEAGFDDAVLAMVDAGLRPDDALSEVMQAGRFELVRRLLTHGQGPSKKALAEAMMYNPALFADVDLVRDLIARGVDIKRKRHGVSYLLVAAASGSAAGVRLLLDAGCEPNARTENGDTALHQAGLAQAGDAAAVIRLLLERGARPNQPNCGGEIALHGAVRFGKLDAAKALIDAGEDLHARHECHVPGMSAEQSAKQAQETAQYAQQMMAEFGSLMGDDDDAPPLPDTSEPWGEKLADLQQTMGQAMERMKSKMGDLDAKFAAMAQGSWGTGRPAAEAAADTAQGQAILPELEAYAAAKRQR